MRELDKVLSKGEKIMWEGLPQKQPFIASLFVSVVIASAITVATLVFVMDQIIALLPPAIAPFAIPLLLLGFLCVVSGISLYGYLVYQNTYYAITDKRVILQSGIIGRDFKTIDFDRVTNVEVNVGLIDKIFGHNSGSIFITTPESAQLVTVNDTNRGAFSGSHTEVRIVPTKLAYITDPYAVFAFFKKIPYEAKANMYYPNELRPSMNPDSDHVKQAK